MMKIIRCKKSLYKKARQLHRGVIYCSAQYGDDDDLKCTQELKNSILFLILLLTFH